MLFQPSLPAAPPPVTYILPPAAQEVIYTPLAHNVLFSSKKKRTGLRLVGTKKKKMGHVRISLWSKKKVGLEWQKLLLNIFFFLTGTIKSTGLTSTYWRGILFSVFLKITRFITISFKFILSPEFEAENNQLILIMPR